MTLTPAITYGAVELRGRAELAPVEGDRRLERLRREVRGEGVGQAERGGELGAEQRRPEDVERHVRALARDGLDAREPGSAGQVALQLQDVLREAVGRARVAAQRVHRVLVGARRPAEAEVDAARGAACPACRTARRWSAASGWAA